MYRINIDSWVITKFCYFFTHYLLDLPNPTTMKTNHTISLMKHLALSVLLTILILTRASGQAGFQPLTHVYAFYMNGECGGKLKVRFMYMERGTPNQDINNITFYYKNSSSSWIPFASAINNYTKTYDWSDSWWGSSTRPYSLGAESSQNITFGDRSNLTSNQSHIDFIWNNIPADAYGSSGFITIATSGSFGSFSTWQHTNSSSQLVIPLPVLNAPSTLSATNADHCNKVALTWTLPGSFPCSYNQEIYRNNVYLAQVNSSANTYDDLTAPQGSHTYHIKAVHKTTSTNGTISSFPSNTAIGSKNSSASPPSGITATTSSCDGEIRINWTFNDSDPTSFKIYRSTNTTTFTTVIATLSGSERAYIDASITKNTTYYYKVATVGTCGETMSTSYFTGFAPDIPAKATGVTVTTNGTNNGFIINWTDNSNNETGFIVERSIQGQAGVSNFNVGPNVTTYSDNSVLACVNYTYTIRARNNCDPAGNPSNASSVVRIFPDLSTSFNTTNNKLTASKGYFTNMVQLSWSTLNVDILTQYRIFRKQFGTTNDSILIGTAGMGEGNFIDNSSISGVLYKYTIIGVLNCGGFTRYSNFTEDIGFRTAFGTVSGAITYSGGIAVQNAKIQVSATSSVGASLNFANATGLLTVPASSKLSFTTAATFECWFRTPNTTGTKELIRINSGTKSITLRLVNNMLSLFVNNGSTTQNVSSTTGFLANNYNQATGVVTADSLVVYLNGLRSAALSLSSYTLFPLNNSSISMGSSFVGNLDEVRLFGRLKTAQEVTEDYSRRVNPDDTELKAYYTFDENMAGYNGFFDYSKVGQVFNENHGTMANVVYNSLIPSSSQLAHASYTDASGTFVVTNIGYTGTGQPFIITPSYETHSFSPITRNVFIGEGSVSHSQQDFTDISSFAVSGFVNYVPIGGATLGCPAEGINFKIDGQTVVRNGEPVATDVDGKFDFQVPIGNHVITAFKDGHIFSQGRFPALPVQSFNFQNSVAGIAFVDSTLVKVVGRAVGGSIEAGKKPGMGKSINNIGKTRIHFKSQLRNGCSKITVITNDTSGEYVTYLPPLIYTIDTVKIQTNNDPNLGFGIQQVLDITNATNITRVYDTIRVGNTVVRIDSASFNTRRDFICFAPPQLFLSRTTGRTPTDSVFVGEMKLFTDSINFISLVPSNPFGWPVFKQFASYAARIWAYDIYRNFDYVPAKEFKVPINGSVSIQNGLASGDGSSVVLDVVNGYALYEFRGGLPNLNTDVPAANSYTKTMSVTLFSPGNNGSRFTQWLPNPGNAPFRGYVFGGRTRAGSSFTTSGPQKVDLILRDPPGSGSSATWSRNTSYNTIKRYSNLNNTGGSFMGTAHLGAKWEASVGLVFEVSLENEIGGTAGFGVTKETTAGENGELVTSLSSSLSISTGSNAEQVGSNADVFFGHATNYTFGLADNLLLVKATDCNIPGVTCAPNTVNGFRIGIRQNLAIDPNGINTSFAYTTGEIESIVIPNLVKVRNLILQNGKKRNGLARYNIVYNDTLDDDYAKKFGTNNDDLIWGNIRTKTDPRVQSMQDRTGPSYTFIPDSLYETDSVRMYNDQIRLWKEALARNEKEKYDAFRLNIGNVMQSATNTSIGQATLTREFSVSKSKEVTTFEEVYLSHDEAFGFLALAGGSGIDLSGSLTLGETTTTDDGTSTDTTTTISYTLTDGDPGDLISVDVVDPGTGNGHMFKLRGGQTSCPYEGPEYAHYYKPRDTVMASTYFEDGESELLTDGTFQRHVPTIQVPEPVRYNVPAAQAAIFNLKLGNQSESEDDQTYDLRIVESTNPNGAILTIDGLDPNRAFTVPFRTTLNKTLSIRRGPIFYDYDSILIILKSSCDDDIVDSAYVSAKFIPTCTKPTIYTPADKWTLNRTFQDTMPVIIYDYDYNFGGLKNITFQYKPASSSQWNILETFYKVPEDTDDLIIPSDRSFIEYKWNMKQLVDGPYDIRAVSTCSAPGYADTKVESDVNRGLADRVNPAPFGNPSPADGILSPNDEISIQFNEPVDPASLSYGNFDIRGVLNGSKLQNTASIYFDGDNDCVEVPTGLNLAKRSFSLEFWAKRGSLGPQIIFSQGIDAAQNIQIGFDASNKFYFQIGNDSVSSNIDITDTVAFYHYTVSYDFDSSSCELFRNGVVINTGNTKIYNQYEGGGKTFFGKTSNSIGNDFKGNLRDFRLWSRTRKSNEIISSINISLRGTEFGIMANWRFDEAIGTTVKDYVRMRHGQMKNAVWEINPKGASYRINTEPLVVAASDLVFVNENDFTIEFWFKGANDGTVTSLFSNGRGDSTDNNPSIRWNIEKDAQGRILVKHKGNTFEAVSTSFFDNNWHHFALVLQRATSLTAFVDGNQQNTISSGGLEQFAGNKFWIGGRGYQPFGPEVVDRAFNGWIDEFRIWNSARSQLQIERDRINRLAGTETDLVCYIPFEQYTINMGVPILTPSLVDIKTAARAISGTTALGSGLNNQTPSIKLQRPVEAINFTYALNGDKIILTPNTLPALIENVTLDITVKDVFDLNGNKMQSPKTWIAYVDKNQVKWQDQEFNFTKKRGEALTFTTTVVNSGGAVKQFTISNLPAWLSASPQSGTITPNSTRTITLTVDPNVNIGSYEQEVQLLTDFGFPDGLLVKLKVYADLPSSWRVDPSKFENAMSVVGQIRINNVISTNPDDKLAAFVDGECRGIATLQYFPQIDRYYAFLTVYSNLPSGEQLEFRIWNAAAGKVHADVQPHLEFQSNELVGSVINPQIFNATDKLSNSIPLAVGWNWISFNLIMTDSNDLNRLLNRIQLTNGDILRDQTLFADYNTEGGWAGSLANPRGGIKPEYSYRLKVNSKDTLTITGVEIDPSTRPILLNAGWNWIGFGSQRNLSVTEAFSSLSSSAGDLVKSQNQFALYDPVIGWVGNLTTLIPGKGYMYKSATNTSFMYPRSAMFGKTKAVPNVYYSDYFSYNPHVYEQNMSVVVDPGICSEAMLSGRLSLGAYVGNELRGVTRVTTMNNRGLYFITVSANQANEEVQFKLLDELTGNTISMQGQVTFTSNQHLGSLAKPIEIKPIGSFACESFASVVNKDLNLSVFPNPFGKQVALFIQNISSPELTISVYDITGKQVDEFTHLTQNSQNAQVSWEPELRGISIKPGFYFVEVNSGGQLIRAKIIKK
jgi:hypothetical protein